MKKLILTLIIGSLLALPLSAMAMDAVTNAELEGVAGQAGVTIAFGGSSSTTIDFSALSWGDPDGISTSDNADSAGWLIIDGNISIVQTIADGEKLTLDIASTKGTAYDSTDSSLSGDVVIPANTTFIAVGLPDITTDITVPSTLNIGLGDTSGNISGTLGILNLKNLAVTQGTPATLYVYAHTN